MVALRQIVTHARSTPYNYNAWMPYHQKSADEFLENYKFHRLIVLYALAQVNTPPNLHYRLSVIEQFSNTQ